MKKTNKSKQELFSCNECGNLVEVTDNEDETKTVGFGCIINMIDITKAKMFINRKCKTFQFR